MEQPHSRKGPLRKCAPSVAVASPWAHPLGSPPFLGDAIAADSLRFASTKAVQRSSSLIVLERLLLAQKPKPASSLLNAQTHNQT